MQVECRSRNGRLKVIVAGDNDKAVFQEIASFTEVFDAEHVCGCCTSDNIRPSVRTVKEYTYYELVCNECSAKFQFGQAKQAGGLFPKRRDEQGAPLPNGGWSKWAGNDNQQAPSTPPPSAPQPAQRKPNYAEPDNKQESGDKTASHRKRFFALWSALKMPKNDDYNRFVIFTILWHKRKLDTSQEFIETREQVAPWQWEIVANEIEGYVQWLNGDNMLPMAEEGWPAWEQKAMGLRDRAARESAGVAA